MNPLSDHHPRQQLPTLKKDGNSDGKGVNGFLSDWQRSTPRGVAAKPRLQVLAELFTSKLALSAEFGYRPVVGVPNYLYWIDGQWSLSLIAPQQWSPARRAGFAGQLVLQRDMTWTIGLADNLDSKPAVLDALHEVYEAFARSLDTDRTLEEILPIHVASLPYHRRLHASALSRSVRASITLGNHAAMSCRQWQSLLPQLQSQSIALPLQA